MTLLKSDLASVHSHIAARLHKPEFLTSDFVAFVTENCTDSEELVFAIEGQARISDGVRADGTPYGETDVFHNGVMVISNVAVYLNDGVNNRRFDNSNWQWGKYDLGKRRWRGINFTQVVAIDLKPIPFFFKNEAFMSVKKHLGQANFPDTGPGILGQDYLNYMIAATEKAYANAETLDSD
jgi:hypothetical protein